MLFFRAPKSDEILAKRIRDAEDAISDLRREFNNLALDTADLQDKARRMLNRANAQRRHIDAKESQEPDNGQTSLDDLNRLIQEGRYHG